MTPGLIQNTLNKPAGQEQEPPQAGTAPTAAPQQPGQSPSVGTVPGLPPTAISQQVQSVNDQYAAQQQQAMQREAQMSVLSQPDYLQGYGPTAQQAEVGGQPPRSDYARSSLQDMAEQLAKGYGLEFGRGSLIDDQGNFTSTPDQLAATSGQNLGDVAAGMNRVSQAVNQRRIEEQQGKATAALQAGAGPVQQRGQGSLAALQSGFYQAMAANYTNPNLLPEQQDFSYWIQKRQMLELAADDAMFGKAGGSGAPITTKETPSGSAIGPTGKGSVVTSGPHAGQRPIYTYDPVAQTTRITWESE